MSAMVPWRKPLSFWGSADEAPQVWLVLRFLSAARRVSLHSSCFCIMVSILRMGLLLSRLGGASRTSALGVSEFPS
jgi:hypothetical protein